MDLDLAPARMAHDPPLPALTPSAFLEAAAAKLTALNGGAEAVRLRGIPVKAGGPGRVYGGFVYASVRDPRTTKAIDARVPEAMAGEVEWGREAVLVGLLRYRVSRGEVRPEFRLDAVEVLGDGRVPPKDELLARWAAAAARPKADPRAALAAAKPRVRVVTGVGSVAVDDIRAQLRDAEEDVSLEVVRVSMSRPAEVARAVREGTGSHLLVVTRGGGPDVHDLDTDELIEVIACSPVPVVAALGHAPDDLVLGRVADASFPTPTAFGAWLRTCVEQKRAHDRRVREAEALDRLDALRRAYGRLVWWRTAAVALGALLAAVVAWIAAGR